MEATKALGSGGALADGRAAARQGDWRRALTLLGAADADQPLDPDDLELLGLAAYFSGKPEEAVTAHQRAFAAVRPVDSRRAGLIALHIALVHGARGAMSVAGGWLQEATSLLADAPECEEVVWLAWAEAMMAAEAGDGEAALAQVDAIIHRARAVGVTDVDALATLLKGQVLTSQGEEAIGARLIDGVMALAVAGCLGPLATAWVFCGTVSTTAAAGDLARAWQWNEEAGRCQIGGAAGFPGDCRIHRAELLRLRGEWAKAEIEAASVVDELAAWHTGHEAAAQYELGELSLRRGDLDAAGVAFSRCRELGHSGQPGVSVLALTKGRLGPAAAGIQEALATTRDRYSRCGLLAAAVEIFLAAGRLDDADAAVEELRSLSQGRATIHQARAAHAAGTVFLARRELDNARTQLISAVELWKKVPAPYEEARSRLLLGIASEAAVRDLHVEEALGTFTRLGAVIDRSRAEEALGRLGDAERVTRVFVFTDIEGSTAELTRLGDDAWLGVLRRHDALIRKLVESHHGEVVSSTGDGFFLSFPDAKSALACSLEIQREPLEVRVRIGVHLAEGRRDTGGYSGRGVHEAARICSLGRGGDVVVSAATLEQAGRTYVVSERREAELKGLPGTTEVAYLRVEEAE